MLLDLKADSKIIGKLAPKRMLTVAYVMSDTSALFVQLIPVLLTLLMHSKLACLLLLVDAFILLFSALNPFLRHPKSI